MTFNNIRDRQFTLLRTVWWPKDCLASVLFDSPDFVEIVDEYCE